MARLNRAERQLHLSQRVKEPQANEEDLANGGAAEDHATELAKAIENLRLVLSITQTLEKERIQKLDHRKLRHLV